MKKIIFLAIILSSVFNLNAQTWRQYNLSNGQITDIPFTYTSTATSGLIPGSRGIVTDNFSSDTSRQFFPIDIINDPNAFPWRTIVKFNDVTGVLIDPYHILTAGHAIEFHPYFQNVIFVPGYDDGEQPYSYANAEYFYLLSDYFSGSSKDYAIVKLDRPIGAISGWNGIGYDNSNAYFQNNIFMNANYPSQLPYNGENMFNWKGKLTSVSTEYFISSRKSAGGMSGSPLFATSNNGNIVYGVLTNLGVKYNRITANKFDAINKIIELNTPAQFDMIPLNVIVKPNQIKSGNSPESINFILHNYSAENKSNADITVNVYLSADRIITASDELIASYTYQKSFASKSSELISQTSALPVLNKPSGDYYIGIIVSGDNNTNNNTTKVQDVSKITITTNDLVTVSGRITSSQIGNGVFAVSLNGFPSTTKTDFNGNYETRVPYGWSGTVTPVKSGFDFTTASVTYSGLIQNTSTNYTAAKRTFTISGNVKSPVSQLPLKNTKIIGLLNEPLTDTNGNYSVNVFYDWAGSVLPVRGNLSFTPYTNSVNNVTSNITANFSGGFYISGRSYDNSGSPIQGVTLLGFPVSAITNSYGEYSVFLDSGWTGTATPVKDDKKFIPAQRTYDKISVSLESEDYVEKSAVVLNLKVLLAGAMYENSDTMRTALNYKRYLPLQPPDTLSGNGSAFVYVRDSGEKVTTGFLNTHADIVDWIIIELRDSKNFSIPIDTIAAFVRKDGRVLSITGDSLIPLKPEILPDNYYIIIRHRNHLSIMSNNPVFLNSFTELYDFTLGLDMYFGYDAHELSNGKFAMYPGDADGNGTVNLLDYQIFQQNNLSAITGYIFSDFNMDGIHTGSDFNTFAPINKMKSTSNVPGTEQNKSNIKK